VTPPTQVVSPAAVVSGRSALFGPKRCVTRNFVASVTGRQIAKVQFYINNRLVATRTKRVNGRFSYLVKAGSLSFATKKLTAKVTYVAAAKTKAKTMSFTFSRCAKAAVSQFTG
jgi:glucose-6-phosphate isomerase